jgi:hypothetical protein
MIQIVQCRNDGGLEDIRVSELLRAKNAKVSFNLNIGLHDDHRSQPWSYKDCKDVRRLAHSKLADVYDGCTIANHLLTHHFADPHPPSRLGREVIEIHKQLQNLFQQPVLGFGGWFQNEIIHHKPMPHQP